MTGFYFNQAQKTRKLFGIPPEIRETIRQLKSPRALVLSDADVKTIEQALLLALQYVRNAHDAASIQAATGKAQRAATLLKRACEAAREGGKT